jgi:hypothetical protein
MRRLFSFAYLATVLSCLNGSTLQQLSLDDMIRKSTVIVRGRIQQSTGAYRGALIYTHYQVQVSEVLKGASSAAQLDVAVPGGANNGKTQTFAGAPALVNGGEYVLFLWTSKGGLTQVIGLSQGLFTVGANASGQLMVTRTAASERMLNALGKTVTDTDLQMLLSDLRTRIRIVLNGGKTL